MPAPIKKHKYKAKSKNGFSSKIESAVFDWLSILQKSGKISDLKKQISYLKGLSVFNVEYSSGGRIRQISVEAASCRIDGKNTIFEGTNNEFIAMFEGVITVIKE